MNEVSLSHKVSDAALTSVSTNHELANGARKIANIANAIKFKWSTNMGSPWKGFLERSPLALHGAFEGVLSVAHWIWCY